MARINPHAFEKAFGSKADVSQDKDAQQATFDELDENLKLTEFHETR